MNYQILNVQDLIEILEFIANKENLKIITNSQGSSFLVGIGMLAYKIGRLIVGGPATVTATYLVDYLINLSSEEKRELYNQIKKEMLRIGVQLDKDIVPLLKDTKSYLYSLLLSEIIRFIKNRNFTISKL